MRSWPESYLPEADGDIGRLSVLKGALTPVTGPMLHPFERPDA